MKTHRTDLLALLFGLAFLIGGAAFFSNELADTTIDGAWIAAVSFVLLGVVALAVTLTRGGRDHDEKDDDEPEIEAEPAT
jgi:hypothetical protein